MKIQDRIEDVRTRVGFAEAAQALSLSGSAKAGFDCPACGGGRTIGVRADNRGGRCKLDDCRKGFSVVELTMARRQSPVVPAVIWLERLAAELEAGPKAAQPGFFDEG